MLAAHLTGDVHIGLYPMLSGDQTSWLAADFDGPAAMLDALAYLKAARAVGAPAALEVSRSGVGAHVWIFFTDAVPIRLVGAVLADIHDEWQSADNRRYLSEGSMALLYPDRDTGPIAAINSGE